MGPASLVLLVSFWLPWYSFGPFSADGVGAHSWLFIAVLDAIVLVLYFLITAFGVGDLAVPGAMSKDQLLAILTGVNLVLVVLAFLLKPTGFSWSYGAFLAAGRRHRRVLAVRCSRDPGAAPALKGESGFPAPELGFCDARA